MIMANEVKLTTYGAAAHDALAEFVAQHKSTDPLNPITIIVPNHYIGMAARRALAARGGVIAVDIVTSARLAERLVARALHETGRLPLSTTILAGAIRAELRETPGCFEGVHNHNSTERSLLQACKRLAKLPESELRQLTSNSNRTADVVRISSAVKERTSAHYFNEQDLTEVAINAVYADNSILLEWGALTVFLPERCDFYEIQLLKALRAKRGLYVIAAASGNAQADIGVRFTVEQLGFDWQPPRAIPAPVADHALSVADADDEVRHVVRKVVAMAVAGGSLDRCAVLYGNHEPYAAIIADAFDAAGINWYGRSVQHASSSLVGKFVLGMLALGDNGFSRTDVFAWLAGAPVRIDKLRLAPTAAWERVARSAGVVRGLSQWSTRLGHFIENRNQEAELFRHDPEQDWRVKHFEREAQHAGELAEFVAKLASDLELGGGLHSWQRLARWCRGLVDAYLGGVKKSRAWPKSEQAFAKTVRQAIDKLARLDDIDPNPSVATFRGALTAQLDSDRGKHGKFGQGVFVGPVSEAVGLELDLAIFLGLAEGTMPPRHRDDPLLPDRMSTGGSFGLLGRVAKTQDIHRCLLAVMAAAKESWFFFPRGDLRKSAQRAPSRWLLDTCQTRDGVRPPAEEIARSTSGWFVEVPSFVAGLRATSFPAHRQEYDMRALLDWKDDREALSEAQAVLARPEVGFGVEVITNRWSSRFTRFDGNLCNKLATKTQEKLLAETKYTSASKLELWARCPHAYFVRYVLGVDAIEDKGVERRISPLDYGKLVHRVLERWIKEAKAQGSLPAPRQGWDKTQVERLLSIGAEEAALLEKRGAVGHGIYWQRDKQIFLSDLEAFTQFDSEHRSKTSTTPHELELGFGLPTNTQDAVPITLPNGYVTNLRGSIDRLDVSEDGHLTVLDYKTGSTRKYDKLDQDPLRGGTVLQLVLYAVAAQQLVKTTASVTYGKYWFVTRKGSFEFRGYRISHAIQRAGLSTVADITEGIRKGLFPAHPAAPSFRSYIDCTFCEPDGLGISHQYSDWLRKQQDTALAPYLAIIGDENVK